MLGRITKVMIVLHAEYVGGLHMAYLKPNTPQGLSELVYGIYEYSRGFPPKKPGNCCWIVAWSRTDGHAIGLV